MSRHHRHRHEEVPTFCPECGAPFKAPPDARGDRTCPYCGTVVVVAPPESPPEHRSDDAHEPKHREGKHAKAPKEEEPKPKAKPKKRSRPWLTIPLYAVTIAVAMVALDWAHGFELYHMLFPDHSRIGWAGGWPIVTDTNGDHTADLVGAYHAFRGAKRMTYVGAFDGRSMKRLWSIGPFGTADAKAPGLGVAGARLVVVEWTGEASIYDLHDGKRISGFHLDDRPDRMEMCRLGDMSEVWIYPNVVVDLDSGVTRHTQSGRRPNACVDEARIDPSVSAFTQYVFESVAAHVQVPTFRGYRVRVALVDGDMGVGLARPRVGRDDSPVAIGFDPTTRKERWRAPLRTRMTSSHDPVQVYRFDLSGGRVLVSYADPKHYVRLLALDARTGNELWDVPIPGALEAYAITDGRLWAVRDRAHFSSLFVVDLAHGKVVAGWGVAPLERDPHY